MQAIPSFAMHLVMDVWREGSKNKSEVNPFCSGACVHYMPQKSYT